MNESNRGLELILRGVEIVDPLVDGPSGPVCIRVERGLITEIGSEVHAENVPVLDLEGHTVVPGLLDLSANLGEPGAEDTETIETAALAAAAGGFTGIASMPNTPTPNDSRAVTDLIRDRARAACGTRVHPVGALTRNDEGKQLTEMWELADGGAVAVSDIGGATESNDVMRRGMEYARMCDLPVFVHCDERGLRGRGVMHEGFLSTTLGLRGIPAPAEEIHIARSLSLAAHTGCRLHVQHLSTARGVELVRRAKIRGLPVTAEVSPHHLVFTDEAVRGYDTRFKTNPPLRSADDRAALRAGLLDGTIDVIASNHHPHSQVVTDVEFDRAPFGVTGLETSFSAGYQAMVIEEGMDLRRFLELYTCRPRGVLRLPESKVARSEVADFTVLDLRARRKIVASEFKSLASNCPFVGTELPVRTRLTVAGGRLTFDTRQATGTPDPTALTMGEDLR